MDYLWNTSATEIQNGMVKAWQRVVCRNPDGARISKDACIVRLTGQLRRPLEVVDMELARETGNVNNARVDMVEFIYENGKRLWDELANGGPNGTIKSLDERVEQFKELWTIQRKRYMKEARNMMRQIHQANLDHDRYPDLPKRLGGLVEDWWRAENAKNGGGGDPNIKNSGFFKMMEPVQDVLQQGAEGVKQVTQDFHRIVQDRLGNIHLERKDIQLQQESQVYQPLENAIQEVQARGLAQMQRGVQHMQHSVQHSVQNSVQSVQDYKQGLQQGLNKSFTGLNQTLNTTVKKVVKKVAKNVVEKIEKVANWSVGPGSNVMEQSMDDFASTDLIVGDKGVCLKPDFHEQLFRKCPQDGYPCKIM